MQNIKKFLIFSIFILSSIECLGKGAFNDAGKAAAQVLAPAAVDAARAIGADAIKALAISNVEIAKIMAPTIVDASKVIGYDAAKALADSNLEAAQVLASASIDASKTLGSDAAKAFADGNLAIVEKVMPYAGPAMVAATVIGAVGVTIYGVTQIQPIAKDTYYFMYPTKEQLACEEKAGEVVEYIAARVKLRKCFTDSKPKDERNAFGRPINCEKFAQAFIMCGGKKEVIEMTADFNEYWV